MDWKKLYQDSRIDSELMRGRGKMRLADVPGNECHITDVDFVERRGDVCCIFVAEEYPNNFMYGGSVITDDLRKISEQCGGLGNFNEQLGNSPMHVKFSRQQSKSGPNEYWVMEVL